MSAENAELYEDRQYDHDRFQETAELAFWELRRVVFKRDGDEVRFEVSWEAIAAVGVLGALLALDTSLHMIEMDAGRDGGWAEALAVRLRAPEAQR